MKAIGWTILAALLAAAPAALADPATAPVAGGAQYDTTHVYVAPADVDRLVDSFTATFGGSAAPAATVDVTPTPSQELWRAVQTPVGPLSVFGFTSPIPYPFGAERTGYLVSDMDAAVAAARAAGADVLVAPFPDPIGRDAVIQLPGGVTMQLYWHVKAPNAPPLASIPENRIYVSPDRADAFVRAFLAFSQGKVTSDDAAAPGAEIGEPGQHYRRIEIDSGFGKLRVMVIDGHQPWPYGRETTGYEVTDLDATLAKATAAGAKVVVAPVGSGGRMSALVQFPGGYIAEIHMPARRG